MALQKTELGTRDTGSYATFSDVIDYMAWLEVISLKVIIKEKIKRCLKSYKIAEQEIVYLIINGDAEIRGPVI